MPLLRAQRMLNAIETGNIDSTALATLMEDEGRVSELSLLMSMPGAARRIAQSDIVVNTIADVEAAAKVAGKNSVMLDALAERSDAFKKLAQSTYWSGDQDIVLELLRRATTAKAILDLNETRGSVASGACVYTAVTALSTTKFLVAYSMGGGYFLAVAVSLVDGVTTVGTPVQINSVAATSTSLSVVAISDTKAVVCYNLTYCTACVITVDGLTITYGTPAIVRDVSPTFTCSAKLTETKVLVVFGINANIYGNVLTISGDSFSVGANCTLSANTFTYTDIAVLTETSVIIAAHNSLTTSAVVVAATISGTTITAGSTVNVVSGTTSYETVVRMTDNTAVVCYNGPSNYLYACVLTVSGTSISVVTIATIDTVSSDPSHLTSVPLTRDKFLLAYRTTALGVCRLNIVSLVNGTPAIAVSVFPGVLPTYMSAAPLDGYRTAIVYRDDGTTKPSFIVIGV